MPKGSPKPSELPAVLKERILYEIDECAALTPKRHGVLLQWTLVNIADVLLEQTVPDGAPGPSVEALDLRIRQALMITTSRLADLFPAWAGHFGMICRTAAALIQDGTIKLGTKKMPAVRS
jgi:hypothetical protein